MGREQNPARVETAADLAGRKRLLADERVRDWYENKAAKSRLSAITNVRKLDFLLEQIGLTLDELEAMARDRPEVLRRALSRYAIKAKAAGRLDAYLAKLFVGAKAYLHFRRIQFDSYPELDSVTGASVATERVPTQQELALVLERLSSRGRVIALLMAHTGVRPQVIGAYEGARGLVLSDLPELDVAKLEFEKVPFLIRGRAELAKTRKAWNTFGTPQLANAILGYLRERRDRGETLGPSSPLVTVNKTRGIAARSRELAKGQLGFLTTTHVTLEVAGSLHALAPPRTRWRPYALRGYFSTALLRAGTDRELRESLMSHGGDRIASAYNVGKRWGTDLVEKAREEYGRAVQYLETTSRPTGDVKTELLTELATAIEEATGKKTNSSLKGDELARAIRQLLGASAKSSEQHPVAVAMPAQGRTGEQKVVDADSVESYLSAGWTFKSPLNGRLAVIEWVSRR